MKLRDRIYKNLVTQLLNGIKATDLRRKLNQLEQENTATVGAMALLSEFYKEETGNELQQDLNTDPSWSGVMDMAEKEAQRLYSSDATDVKPVVAAPNPVTPVKPAPVLVEPTPQPAPKPPVSEGQDAISSRLKRVSDNKKVMAQQEKSAERTREPVKIVIDDTPISYDDTDDDSN